MRPERIEVGRALVIFFKSPLHILPEEETTKTIEDVLSALVEAGFEPKSLGVYSSPTEANEECDLLIFYFLTGGTGRIAFETWLSSRKPVILLAGEKNNALPSARRAEQLIRWSGGFPVVIYHEDFLGRTLRRIAESAILSMVPWKLSSSTFGVVGGDLSRFRLAESMFGFKTVEIPIETVIDSFEGVDRKQAEEGARELASRVLDILEPSMSDVTGAYRLYIALKKTVESLGLNAISVDCFPLIEELKIAPCLAVSLLNDEGVTFGCEAEADSLLTMHIFRLLTGKPSWMVNVNTLNYEKRMVGVSHCTMPASLSGGVESVTLRSHFESKSSVAVSGDYKPLRVTLAKITGKKFEKLYLARGRVLKSNLMLEYMCRSQAFIKLDQGFENFVFSDMGNHIVVMAGDHIKSLKRIAEFYGLEVKI